MILHLYIIQHHTCVNNYALNKCICSHIVFFFSFLQPHDSHSAAVSSDGEYTLDAMTLHTCSVSKKGLHNNKKSFIP